MDATTASKDNDDNDDSFQLLLSEILVTTTLPPSLCERLEKSSVTQSKDESVSVENSKYGVFFSS